MTLLEKLQAHRGGLLRIKTQLSWYGRGWDGVPGRICLVLDAAVAPADRATADADATAARVVSAATTTAPLVARVRRAAAAVAALLLVDGAPRWVWVAAEDVELIDEAR